MLLEVAVESFAGGFIRWLNARRAAGLFLGLGQRGPRAGHQGTHCWYSCRGSSVGLIHREVNERSWLYDDRLHKEFVCGGAIIFLNFLIAHKQRKTFG